MRFEHEAAFIEQMVDHVQVKATHYMFDLMKDFNMEEVKDRMEKLGHFLKWLEKECQHDLIVPRGRHGKSYQELRNDEALKNDHPPTCVRCGAEGFPYCPSHNPMMAKVP